MINALNSGARVLHGRPRGRALARPGRTSSAARPRCATPSRGTLDLRDAGGQALSPGRRARHARRPAARLAPRRAPRPGRRRAGVGEPVRLRAVPRSTTRPSALARGQRAVPLPAQARVPPRGAPLERRLRARPGRRSGIPRGSIRATVLIETILRRLRDGRDPVRAARARRRASMPAAGTTSSASSRSSANGRGLGRCPIAAR